MSENNVDKFACGELSREESRELAREALNDSELFEDLTSIAVARVGLQKRGRQIAIWPGIAILAAAAIVILAVALHNSTRQSRGPEPVVAQSTPPVFLAHNADSNPSVFRGADSESRLPRAIGSVVSIDGGAATIDLGSLDGLSKGVEVDVIRDGQKVGKITVATVFRDRARAGPETGLAIRAHDQVRVSAAGQLRAVLDQIEAANARGDSGEARRVAAQASIETFDAGISSTEDLNNAGIVAELHGDKRKAVELYEHALRSGPSDRDRQAIESNLARAKGSK